MMLRALFLAFLMCLVLPLTAEARAPIARASVPAVLSVDPVPSTGEIASRTFTRGAAKAALVCPFAGNAAAAMSEIPAVAPPRAVSNRRPRPAAEATPQRRGTPPPERPPRNLA